MQLFIIANIVVLLHTVLLLIGLLILAISIAVESMTCAHARATIVAIALDHSRLKYSLARIIATKLNHLCDPCCDQTGSFVSIIAIDPIVHDHHGN